MMHFLKSCSTIGRGNYFTSVPFSSATSHQDPVLFIARAMTNVRLLPRTPRALWVAWETAESCELHSSRSQRYLGTNEAVLPPLPSSCCRAMPWYACVAQMTVKQDKKRWQVLRVCSLCSPDWRTIAREPQQRSTHCSWQEAAKEPFLATQRSTIDV